MNVYQKLNAAREEFHTAKLKKSGHNKFANYYYFELGDFVIPALAIFKKHGLTSLISFGPEHAEMMIVNNEKPEDKVVLMTPMSSASLKGCHEVQNLGAVQTYLRRYLWVAALEIVEHDALDASEPVKTTKSAPVITPNQNAADEVSADEKIYLSELAQEMTPMFNNGREEDMYTHLMEQNLTNEQKTFLWTLLDSKIRTFISSKQKK